MPDKDKSPSKKGAVSIGPEVWWTRLKELAVLPGFEKLLDDELKRWKISN